jgi:hypothetical protein
MSNILFTSKNIFYYIFIFYFKTEVAMEKTKEEKDKEEIYYKFTLKILNKLEKLNNTINFNMSHIKVKNYLKKNNFLLDNKNEEEEEKEYQITDFITKIGNCIFNDVIKEVTLIKYPIVFTQGCNLFSIFSLSIINKKINNKTINEDEKFLLGAGFLSQSFMNEQKHFDINYIDAVFLDLFNKKIKKEKIKDFINRFKGASTIMIIYYLSQYLDQENKNNILNTSYIESPSDGSSHSLNMLQSLNLCENIFKKQQNFPISLNIQFFTEDELIEQQENKNLKFKQLKLLETKKIENKINNNQVYLSAKCKALVDNKNIIEPFIQKQTKNIANDIFNFLKILVSNISEEQKNQHIDIKQNIFLIKEIEKEALNLKKNNNSFQFLNFSIKNLKMIIDEKNDILLKEILNNNNNNNVIISTDLHFEIELKE